MNKLYSLLVVLAAGAAHAQVDTNKTVAIINGEEIKGGEYYHRMEYLSGVGKVSSSGVMEFPPGFLTIEQIITERLILQLAKNKGVYPSDLEVDKELQTRQEENPKMMENWINSGRSEADLKYMTRLELAQFKISTAGVTVTDQEVEDHYKNNPEMYTTPKMVKLAVIVVRDDAAKKAVDDGLTAKKPFSELAKSYSADVTKGVGGELGTIYITALSGEVRAAIEKIKIGEITPWLSTQDARVRFLLEDVTAAKKDPLTPALKRDIRKRLMLDRGKVRNNIGKEMFDLRMNAKIDIKDKVFAEAYTKYIDAYKKDMSLKGVSGN
ncbi:MAG: hypothetical protein BGO01_11850 [Armatimonadetes bacterium 55-13]|nr:MAG: hypothetical protein BGO01_11850 [Armatimonadetes bacterium 55-13]